MTTSGIRPSNARADDRPRPNKAIVYTRLSSDPGHDGKGVARQRASGDKFCRQWGFDPVYLEDNDTSATNGAIRSAYLEALRLVQSGEVRAVWSWGHDRFFRDPGQLEAFMPLAKRNEVLFADRAGIKDLSKAGDRFAARNSVNAAALEIENMKERQQEAFDQLAHDGLAFWSHRPFGYTLPTRNDDLERVAPAIVADEAALITQAYYDILAGRSLRSIARHWNDIGARTPTRKIRSEVRAIRPGAAGGNEWVPLNVRQLLLSPRNAGLRERVRTERDGTKQRIIGREVLYGVETEWEAIIPIDVWKGVCAKLQSNTRAPDAWSRKYLMSGLAVCGHCGKRVNVITPKGQKPTYQCRHCTKVRRSVPRVDTFVKGLVVKHLADRKAIEAKLASDIDTAGLRARLVELDGIEAELGEALGAGMKFAIVKPQLDEANAERERINALLAAQPHRARPLHRLLQAADVAQVWDAMDLDEQRAAVDVLFTLTILPGQPGGNAPFDPAYIRVDPKL